MKRDPVAGSPGAWRQAAPPPAALCERLRVPVECRELALLMCAEHTLVHRAAAVRGQGDDGISTRGGTFLRGTQFTDADGQVRFATIYPGWYQGRPVHIHLKVHDGGSPGATYEGGHVSHTGQLFFAEDVSRQVMALAPYAVFCLIFSVTARSISISAPATRR